MIHILVIDDNRGDRRLIQEAFKEINLPDEYQLHGAADGLEALQLMGAHAGNRIFKEPIQPDLIILDLNMPRMDGREFLSIIKSHSALSDIPVLVLTTSEAETDIYEAYRLNANCYVVKPLDIGEFIDTVQRLGNFWLSLIVPDRKA